MGDEAEAERRHKAETEAEETIELSPSMIGRIIGRGGEVITKLQEESGAKIDIDKYGQPPTIRVHGESDCVVRAIDLISDIMDEHDKSHGSGSSFNGDVVEETSEVPRNKIRGLIGKGGETVMKLQDDSGAKIDISKTDGTVRIRGTSDAVTKALDMISDLVDKLPADRSVDEK